MPTLHWIGKEKVINHHLDVPYRVLEYQYTFSSQKAEALEVPTATNLKAEALEAETTGNKIIHGDNLEALKSLLPEYEGKIKCIYIDPPYNTGNEGWVYNDNVNDPKIKKWLGQVVGKEAEDLTRHDKWLCMMYPRLKLLHKLLAEDGAIFISIDDNEQANLKLMCDEIFGRNNLLANQVWENKEGGGSSDSKHFRIKHEYIMTYSKNINKIFISGIEITNADRYTSKDEHLIERGPFYLQKLGMGSIQYSESLDYPITAPDNSVVTATEGNNNKKACWRWGKDKFIWGIQNDFIVFKKDKTDKWQVYTKQYLRCDNYGNIIERTNRPMGVINSYSSTQASKSLETIFSKKIFDYSKPVPLLDFLFSIITDKNSIVLDSFAGSGTTAHAVLNLNKQDGGNRKFICIEMEDYAETITAERVKRVINGYGATGSPQAEGTGGSFDYYELGPALFNEDNEINELVGVEKLRQYMYYTETKTALNSLSSIASVMTSRASVIEAKKDNEYLLNKHNDTAYYFYYEQDGVTTLNHDFLSTIKTRAEQYVIYADNCLLTKEFMTKHHIIFKKIPRDITKF